MKLNMGRAMKNTLLACALGTGLIAAGGGTALAAPSIEGAASSVVLDARTGGLSATTGTAVVLDAQTGAVVSVSKTPTSGLSLNAISNPCGTRDTYWKPISLPYSQIGFTSAQNYTGTWTDRGTLVTSGHSVKGICWIPQGGSSQVCNNNAYGAGVSVGFTQAVTGKSVNVTS
jgi:hypothetical protein